MGQGLHTKMVQVASRVLAVDISKIHIIDTSTETIANTTPTGGSSGTDLNGFAVINACKKLVEVLDPIRQQFPDDTWEQVVEKAYFSKGQLSAFGFYNSSPLDYDEKTDEGSVFNYLTFGVGCSVVEVDCLTGEHQLLRTDIVMDVGRSLNPAIDIGQIEGAFVQGCGYVTMEEIIHSKQGGILNNNLSTYKVIVSQRLEMSLLRNISDSRSLRCSRRVQCDAAEECGDQGGGRLLQQRDRRARTHSGRRRGLCPEGGRQELQEGPGGGGGLAHGGPHDVGEDQNGL